MEEVVGLCAGVRIGREEESGAKLGFEVEGETKRDVL